MHTLSQHNNKPPNKVEHKTKKPPSKTLSLSNNHKQTNKNSNLLYKARLHAQEGGGDKSTTLKTYPYVRILCSLQMSSRGKAVHEAIMRSPTDTNMEDIEDTMVLETIPNKRAQDPKRGGSSSKRKKNVELSTGLKETPSEFWLGITAMEKLVTEEGVKAKDCRPPTKKEELIEMGMLEAET